MLAVLRPNAESSLNKRRPRGRPLHRGRAKPRVRTFRQSLFRASLLDAARDSRPERPTTTVASQEKTLRPPRLLSGHSAFYDVASCL